MKRMAFAVALPVALLAAGPGAQPPAAAAAAAPASPAALMATAMPGAAPPSARPHGIHYLYLVRHGAYDPDTVDTDDRTGSPLNALGHEQARLIGERLAALPVRLHALVSSDFTRARETADDMGRILHMTPVRDSLLHECTPATDRADIMKTTTPEAVALCESNLQAAWNKYFVPTPEADTYDVLVCHGNVIRWTVAHALGMDPRTWLRMDIGNGSLTVLTVRADGLVRMATFSDVGHLPVAEQTWTGTGGGWGKKAAAK